MEIINVANIHLAYSKLFITVSCDLAIQFFVRNFQDSKFSLQNLNQLLHDNMTSNIQLVRRQSTQMAQLICTEAAIFFRHRICD